jgi:hypothetical protein
MLNRLRNCLTILVILCLCSSCGVVVRGIDSGYTEFSQSQLFHKGRSGPLTEQEQRLARIAWIYFENNYKPETGLVHSINGYPSITMWEIGDYLAALTAARELEIIEPCDFDKRLASLLGFLNSMDLAFGKLPNKVYSTKTGKMTNYANKPGMVGWSAIDIGRLLIWLQIVKNRYPVYSEYIDKAVLRWNVCDIIDDEGNLIGAYNNNNKMKLYQEGRLGYEEYAAKGFQLWGFDTTEASAVTPYKEFTIHDIAIPYDSRNVNQGGDKNPVLSLGYFLHGLEFNWDVVGDRNSSDTSHSDATIADFADRIYRVQEARWNKERIFTARTDHQVAGSPYFVNDSIFAAGYPWNVINSEGKYYKNLATVSTRAAFPMWSLWKTTYTDCLFEAIKCLHSERKGWYEGRLENSGKYLELLTLSTNATVLESFLYKTRGKLLDMVSPHCRQDTTYYWEQNKNEFTLQGRCFPGERARCQPRQ